jgi:hypothetical protein
MLEKKQFSIGLVSGILLAALFFHFFAPRFYTIESGNTIIKQDKWSGDSWRFVDNQWRKMMSVDQQWQQIDQTLKEALHISSSSNRKDPVNPLELLKNKYPILKSITDEELNERIKIVYSKEILSSLYLNNFLEIQSGSDS